MHIEAVLYLAAAQVDFIGTLSYYSNKRPIDRRSLTRALKMDLAKHSNGFIHYYQSRILCTI